MTAFSKTHIIYIALTILFFVLGCLLCRKLNKKWQNALFVICALLCSGGIVFRYGFGLGAREFSFKQLALQMLQVCNFNLILVVLMLVPKCELARQYAVYFSMFCAFTTFLSVPSDWNGRAWYDIYVVNSWLNHTFAIALPLFMVASKRLKPQKKYIWRVALCVFIYFTAVYAISEILGAFSILNSQKNFSFVYYADGVVVLQFLRNLIGLPYFYLYPLFPFIVVFFYLLSHIFKNYMVGAFYESRTTAKKEKRF